MAGLPTFTMDALIDALRALDSAIWQPSTGAIECDCAEMGFPPWNWRPCPPYTCPYNGRHNYIRIACHMLPPDFGEWSALLLFHRREAIVHASIAAAEHTLSFLTEALLARFDYRRHHECTLAREAIRAAEAWAADPSTYNLMRWMRCKPVRWAPAPPVTSLLERVKQAGRIVEPDSLRDTIRRRLIAWALESRA